MALLTDGAAASLIFAPPPSAPWKALAPLPGWPTGSALGDAVANTTSLPVLVTYAAAGNFAYPGGQATGYDDTLVPSSPLTTVTTTSNGSTSIAWVKDGADVYICGANLVLELMDPTEMTALKAFLP